MIWNDKRIAITRTVIIQEETSVLLGGFFRLGCTVLVGQANNHANAVFPLRVQEPRIVVVTVPDLEPLPSTLINHEVRHVRATGKSHGDIHAIIQLLNHSIPVAFWVYDDFAIDNLTGSGGTVGQMMVGGDRTGR